MVCALDMTVNSFAPTAPGIGLGFVGIRRLAIPKRSSWLFGNNVGMARGRLYSGAALKSLAVPQCVCVRFRARSFCWSGTQIA